MNYGLISGFFFLLALCFLALAFVLLKNRHWLMGFIRGSCGLIALSFAILVGLVAQDLSNFNALSPNQSILTLSFKQTAPGKYLAELQESNGNQQSVPVIGEQWQLDLRMFFWKPLLKAVGFRTGYQLHTLSGTSATSPQSLPVPLDTTIHRIDVWTLVHEDGLIPVLTAVMETPGALRIVDGAIYDIVLTGTDLSVTPMNDIAKSAMTTP